MLTCRCVVFCEIAKLFHDGGRYHIETSPLICEGNQWTGFYMVTPSFMKELINETLNCFFYSRVLIGLVFIC